MSIANLADEPQTAADAGISPYERRTAIARGLITVVKERGKAAVKQTGSRGRPAHLLKLTAKGKRYVAKNA